MYRLTVLTLGGLLAFTACGDKDTSTGDDTAAAADDTSAGDDTSSTGDDTHGTDDTVEDPGDAEVTGSVETLAGLPLEKLRVQLCEYSCLETTTDATGGFGWDALDGGSYKMDALGEFVEGANYGHIRIHVDLDMSEIYATPTPLLLPVVSDTSAFSGSGSQTLSLNAGAEGGGTIQFTANPDDLTPPFGFNEDYAAGVVVDVPDFWEHSADLAVAFLPFATTVAGEIGVEFDLPAGTSATSWDVYSVEEKGYLSDSPVGSATASGGTVQVTASPALLTWLVLVAN